jgi:hypothetical protein
VALGDSYVKGWCVPSDKNFVASIRRDFPRTLNLGVTGHGPLMMLGTLKEYASRVKPRVVMWFYFDGNDLGDLKKERQSPLLMRYLDKDFLQRLYNRQPEIESALAHYLPGEMNRLRRSNFVEESAPPKNRIQELEGFIKLAETRTRLGLTGVLSSSNDVDQENEFEEVKRLLTRVLAEAKRTVDTWNGEIYFVYLTGFSGWERDAEKEQVLKVARNLGFPIIDLHAAFDEHGDPFSLFPFRQPAHYNEIGHQYVAQVVLKSLELDTETHR